MLVPMTKERFVLRMMADAAAARDLDRERQRRLSYELNDYVFAIRHKRLKWLATHQRAYR